MYRGLDMEIFTKHKIGNIELKNRIVMAPMCMYESDNSGEVKPFHFAHYPTRAYGGVGLIIQEATAVTKNGRITGNDLGIWADYHIEGLQNLVNNVHLAGAKMGIQLAHAGRKCTVKDEFIVAPSAIPFSEKYQTPHELDILEIKEVVKAFKDAAARAIKVGYDLIEIHAAHGYLINQFISPLTNKRTDEYGGSLENRSRLLVEVVNEIRNIYKGPLVIRVSAEEFDPNGHNINETIKVLNLVKDKIDAVNVSSGGVVNVLPPNVFEGYQIDSATRIKESGFCVIGGGFIRSHEYIEKILQDHKVDFVFLGRELLLNPFYLQRLLKEVDPSLVIKAYKRSF